MIRYAISMSESELVLKITPPRLPRGVVERERLLRFWTLTQESTAIAVVAPAGFGKTTLLLQWRRRWMEQGAVVAWLGADSLDEPTRFTQALLKSIRGASGKAVFDALANQYESGMGPPTAALTTFLAEVALLGAETVLMIDEAERLPEATVRASLQYLLLNAPANFHIVVGTRVPLPMETWELTAKGSFVALEVEDLRLRLEESLGILGKRLEGRLDLNQQAKLHDVVEGWPIALQLAIAKIEHEEPPAIATETFSARRGDIRNYFVESLASRLSPPEAGFLIRIAILDYFNAALCEAVTGDPQATALLAGLAAKTPIVTAGGHEDWVRLHPLARDFLMHRFEQLPHGEQVALHTRASRWFAAHGRFHEAARHAFAAREDQSAHDYAMRSLWALGTAGKLTEARELLARIPPHLIGADVSTKLVAAWVFALSDRNEDALRISLDIAGDPATNPHRRMAALRVAGGAAIYADRLGLLPHILAQWPQSDEPVEDPLYIVAPLNAKAILSLHMGSTRHVRDLVAQVTSQGNSGSLGLAFALAQTMAGLSHLWDGDAYQVESRLRQALAIAEKEQGRRSMVASVYAAVLADAYIALDRTADAQSLLANRLDVIEDSFPDIVLAAYRALTSIALRLGDERRALIALGELAALGKRRQIPRLRMHSLAEQIRLHAAAGRSDTAEKLLAALERLAPAFRQDDFLVLQPQHLLSTAMAKAHVALMHRDTDEAERQLESANVLADQLYRGRDALTIRALRAAVAQRRGSMEAKALLSETLGLAEFGGTTRVLSETHPLVAQMLGELHDTATGPKVHQPAKATTALLPMDAPSPASSIRSGLLTSKEIEVLRLLDKGMSNKLIARTLDISSETVKWHLKNLFQKLSAGTRRHAVDRARLLGMVDG